MVQIANAPISPARRHVQAIMISVNGDEPFGQAHMVSHQERKRGK
jgi:hypothetical protein